MQTRKTCCVYTANHPKTGSVYFLIKKWQKKLLPCFWQFTEAESKICQYCLLDSILITKIWFCVSNSVRKPVNGSSLRKTERCQSCVFPCGGKKIFQSVPSWSEQRICYAWKYVNKAYKYCVLELAKGRIALASVVCVLGEPEPKGLKGHKATSIMYLLPNAKEILWHFLFSSISQREAWEIRYSMAIPREYRLCLESQPFFSLLS